MFCLVVTPDLTLRSWFSLASDTGCGGVSHGHAGHVLLVLLGYAGDAVVVITTCVRGILVYSVLSVVMYSPTMKLVASPRRPADEGVPHLRDTKQMRRL